MADTIDRDQDGFFLKGFISGFIHQMKILFDSLLVKGRL